MASDYDQMFEYLKQDEEEMMRIDAEAAKISEFIDNLRKSDYTETVKEIARLESGMRKIFDICTRIDKRMSDIDKRISKIEEHQTQSFFAKLKV